MCRLFLLFLLAIQLSATTAWLRYGGPASRLRVTGAAAGTPASVTLSTYDGSPIPWNVGDTIHCHYVQGVSAVNGFRMVKTINGSVVTLREFDKSSGAGGADVVGVGAYVRDGFCGKVQQYTLPDHPRGLLDGPSGTLTTALKDPDGAGASKSVKADSGWHVWSGLISKYASLVTNPSAQWNNCGQNGINSGPAAFNVSLAWFADNSLTQYRDAAINWLNNAEKMIACGSGFGDVVGWYDEDRGLTGGLNDGEVTDSMAFKSTGWARAYSVIRDQLTSGERTTFANKMLNGVLGEACDNRFQTQSGTISLVNSTTITGVGTTFTNFSAGQWVFFSTTTNLVAYRQAQIASIQSDTSMTLSSVSPNSTPGGSIYQNMTRWGVIPAWTETSCGALWIALHHGYLARQLSNARTARVVSGPNATDTPPYDFVVEDGQAFAGLSFPFYINVTGQGNEWSRVSAISGNNITVDQRGLFGSVQVLTRTGFKDTMSYTPYRPDGGLSTKTLSNEPWLTPYYDNPIHNLNWARTKGMLEAGYLLADDDPRALLMFEKAWAVFYDFDYWYAKNMWTGTGQGGYSYDPARWQTWTYDVALIGKQLTPALDITDGEWLYKAPVIPLALQWPRTPTSTSINTYIAPYSESGVDPYMEPQKYVTIAYAQHLFPTKPETGYAMWWYQQKSGWPTLLSSSDGLHQIAPYLIYTEPDLVCPGTGARKLCTDYTSGALPPNYFFTDSDFDPPENPNNALGLIASKSSWETDATFLFSTALGRGGDHTGAHHGPGTYRMFKNGWWLMAAGTNQTDGTKNHYGNYVQIDPEMPTCTSPTNTNCSALATGGLATGKVNGYGQASAHYHVDRKYGDNDIAWWRVNGTNAFDQSAGVTRHLRSVIHFKGTGVQDYVVVHDDVATSGSVRKARHMICYSEGENNVLTGTGYERDCTRSRATGAARVSTKFLLPTDEGKLVADYTINPSLQKISYMTAASSAPNTPTAANAANRKIISWYVLQGVKQGQWRAVCTEVASPCTVFTVYDPDDIEVTTYVVGAVGNLYANSMVLTLTQPTAGNEYVTGDEWHLNVTPYEPAVYSYASPNNPPSGATLTQVVLWPGAEPGQYEVVCQVSGCATFNVLDPEGTIIGTATPGQLSQVTEFVQMRITAGSSAFSVGQGWRVPMLVSPTMYYMTIDDGNTTSSEFLAVHKAVAGSTGSLPTTELLATCNANSRCGIIRDTTLPRVFVFDVDGGDNGTGDNTNTSYTVTGLSVDATHSIQGLASGTYDVTKDTNPFLSGVSVSQGGLTFTSGNGAYAATRTGTSLPLQIDSSSLPAGTVSSAYSYTITASGGTGPYTFTNLTSMPAGLSIASGGAITGTPSGAGSTLVTFEVTDSLSASATRDLVIQINTGITDVVWVSPSSYQNWPEDTAYPTVTAASCSGGVAPYSYAVTSGALPTGMSWSTDKPTGTPTTAGTYNFTVTCEDSQGTPDTASRAFTIVINATSAPTPVSIVPPVDATCFMNESCSLQFTAENGEAPLVWTYSGTLPNGMTMTSADVTINGPVGTPTLTKPGFYPFEVCVADATPSQACSQVVIRVDNRQADLDFATSASDRCVQVRLRRIAMQSNHPCFVSLRTPQQTEAGEMLAPTGLATREGIICGLQPETQHTLHASCGPYGVTGTVTTGGQLSGAGTMPLNFGDVSSIYPTVDNLLLEYGPSPALGSSAAPVSCATGCSVSVPGNRGEPVYFQFSYRTASNAVLVSSGVYSEILSGQ